MHFILIPKHPSFSPNLLKVLSVLFGCLLFLGVIYFFLIKRDLDLKWIVLGILGFGLWSSKNGQPLMLLISLLGLGFMVGIFLIQVPRFGNWIETLKQQNELIWIEGKIRGYDLEQSELILVQVHLSHYEGQIDVEELEIALPGSKFKRLNLYRERNINLYGRIQDHQDLGSHWKLKLKQWGVSPPNKVLSTIQRFRNRAVLLLQDRAAFYLPNDILSIYLPLTLAKRRSFSTSARLFQQTGMAHLLAISGLHIALIYGIIYFFLKKLFGLSLKLMEWVHLHTMVQLTALSVLWLYIFLLEWPIPALRAATMLSLLVFGNLLGLVQVPLFSLCLTSFMFLIAKPVMLYDLSFQLSFMAVFSILIFLPIHPTFRKSDSSTIKLSKYCLSSLLMTGSVMFGIWPLISDVFSRLSLETFWLNLVMVPLLGVIILPLCLISLLISLFYLGMPPFRPLESEVFQLTEWGIRLWFSLMEEIHKIGGWAVIEGKLTWSIQEYVLYYLMLFSIGFGIFSWKPLKLFFQTRHGFRSK